MEEVLEIYERPFDPKHPVVCVDEMSRQLLEHVMSPLEVKPGSSRKVDSEYQRNGTFNVFMVFEPRSGRCRVKVTEQRTGKEWACLMKELVDEDFAEAERIILVADNLNTHDKRWLYESYDPAEAFRIAQRLEIHHTPKHGSWLNMAEIGLSLLSRQCLQERIGSLQEAAARCKKWEEEHNRTARTVNWQFTAADARIKLRRLYPTIEL